MRFLSGPFYLWFPLLFLNITLAEVKLLVKYPIKLLPPVTGSSFFGNFTNSESDNYYCFGNQDYHPTTYLESLYCLLSLNKLYPSLYSCYSIWGSRSVSITVQGSMEFIQLQQLPRENNLQLLNGTYWLYLNSLDSYYYSHHELDSPVPTAASEVGPTLSVNEEKPTHYSPHFYYNNTLLRHSVHEIKHVDAVPIYLCGRCNNWQKESTTLTKFSLKLRPAFIRARSRAICLRKLIFGALYLFGLSISWLSPLLKAGWAAFFAFSNGLHVFILLVTISIVTLLFTPFILTKKNRSYVRHAYQLFFSTVKVGRPRASFLSLS